MPPTTRSMNKRRRLKKLKFSEWPVDVVVIVLSFYTLNLRAVLLLRERVNPTEFIQWKHVTAYLEKHQMPFSSYRKIAYDHIDMPLLVCRWSKQLTTRMVAFMWHDFQEVFASDWRMGFLKLEFGGPVEGLKVQFFIWRSNVTLPVRIEIRSENHFRGDYTRVFEMRAEGVIERFIGPEYTPALPIAARLYATMTDDHGTFYCD